MTEKCTLKSKNFIPVYGALKYAEEVDSYESKDKVDDKEIYNNGLRLAVIGVYNAVLLMGSAVGLEALLK